MRREASRVSWSCQLSSQFIVPSRGRCVHVDPLPRWVCIFRPVLHARRETANRLRNLPDRKAAQGSRRSFARSTATSTCSRGGVVGGVRSGNSCLSRCAVLWLATLIFLSLRLWPWPPSPIHVTLPDCAAERYSSRWRAPVCAKTLAEAIDSHVKQGALGRMPSSCGAYRPLRLRKGDGH